MSIHFISDLHLHAQRPDITLALFDYLQQLPEQAEALYLLGDIFEAYLGDDDDDVLLAQVKQRLKQLSDKGVQLFFMHGNRDFLVGDDFCQQTGCQLLADPSVIECYGQRYLLMHGDSLCTDDIEYQTFRAQIQNPAMKAMLLAKPLAERREIAKQLRDNSKMLNSNKAQDIMDVNTQAVEQALTEHHVDKLIHGHTHRPAIHDLGAGKQRIVLGDWDKKAWELMIQAHKIELRDFAIEN